MHKGKGKNRRAVKDLVVLVAVSIFVYFLAVVSGGYDAIDRWAAGYGLSRIHMEELVTVLVMSGFASVIFFVRRYRELHTELQERKESERILRTSRAKSLRKEKELKQLFRQVEFVKNEWERTLDSVSDMMILSDVEGKIQRCNRAFMNFVGCSSYREIRGKSLEALLTEQGLEVKNLEVEMVNAQFRLRGKRFDLKSYPYKDIVSGNITGSVVTIHLRTPHEKEAGAPSAAAGQVEGGLLEST